MDDIMRSLEFQGLDESKSKMKNHERESKEKLDAWVQDEKLKCK